ncbi:MAG: PaaI family thioesterase [Actinobacteria bacterium]|nr:PaaI family thioesterase [Actinomycetota bacterium]
MDAAEITAFLDEIASKVTEYMKIEEASPEGARIRMLAAPEQLRPGGIVSGPSLMTLADFAVWVPVLAAIGPEPYTTTVNLNIHFLRRVPPGDVIAETRLLKVGKRLATGDVVMYADGDPDPVAQATVTYTIPSVRWTGGDAPRWGESGGEGGHPNASM